MSPECSSIVVDFRQAVSVPDNQIDLGLAALIISKHKYTDLDIKRELGLFDSLASVAETRMSQNCDPLQKINAINTYLFEEIGFRGNDQDYYNPKNSYLNEVLATRLGIPITLSLLCMEVSKRLSIDLVSIGMPGHIVIQHSEITDLFIDPFHGGILLSKEECIERVKSITQGSLPWKDSYLTPLTNHEFLARMLRNLKSIYLKESCYSEAQHIMDLLLEVNPEALSERRDRGIVNFQLGNYRDSLDDLEIYLESGISGAEASSITKLIWKLRDLLSA
tara:strand:- start:2735 stop:3568 length:834 start_codon:yes stop_codon:yes gene_type:complete